MVYDTTAGPKVVHVRDYTRVRFGRTEHVCEHWRSFPRQLVFDFGGAGNPILPLAA
jgi:hypothetical protein